MGYGDGYYLDLLTLSNVPVSSLIEKTRRVLYGSTRQALNTLAADLLIGSDATTFTYELKGVVEGSIIGINEELIYVVSATPTSKTAILIRGYLGTTPADHVTGDVVEVNPRFPRGYILDILKQEIDSWPPKLFRAARAEISSATSTNIYDLGNTAFQVISVRSKPTSGDTRSALISWTLLRNQDAAVYPSSQALYIRSDISSGAIIEVIAALPLDTGDWSAIKQYDEIGLEDNWEDVAVYGAAWRAMSAREVQRTDMSQPEPRKSEEVPAGHMTSAANQLKLIRDQRLNEEAMRLRERYPIRGSF